MIDKSETILILINHQATTYISSIDEDGFPNTKAMLAPRKIVEMREFYFTTNTSSRRVTQFKKNDKACIYFCDSRFFRGVMLRGKMEVLEDASTKEMTWRDGDTQYYSKGVTDPDYCVLKFTAESSRFYSNFKSIDISVV